jgi:type I restriction enzyme S subunit
MVPVPPKDEQEAIIKVIHDQSVKYDLIIRQAKDEIDLLREYRIRLISDVVTGKIDVRDAKLPEIEDVTNSEIIEDQETLEDVEDTEEVVNADE